MRVKRNCQIRLLSLLVFVIAALFSLEKAYAQMSDEAVVSYVQCKERYESAADCIRASIKGCYQIAVKENQGPVQGY